MQAIEFKAWFDGFCEALEEVPTEKQWKRIKERVGEIDGKPVTEHHWCTHYYPMYPSIYFYPIYTGCNPPPVGGYTTTFQTTCGAGSLGVGQNYQGAQQFTGAGTLSGVVSGNEFSSLTAMNALGRAEAATLTS